jgi:hypothetical protein
MHEASWLRSKDQKIAAFGSSHWNEFHPVGAAEGCDLGARTGTT